MALLARMLARDVNPTHALKEKPNEKRKPRWKQGGYSELTTMQHLPRRVLILVKEGKVNSVPLFEFRGSSSDETKVRIAACLPRRLPASLLLLLLPLHLVSGCAGAVFRVQTHVGAPRCR